MSLDSWLKLNDFTVLRMKKWLTFSLENQNGLEKEYEDIGFPEWNKGYREALNDMLKILESND